VLPFVTFRKQPSAYPFFGDTHIAMRARKTGLLAGIDDLDRHRKFGRRAEDRLRVEVGGDEVVFGLGQVLDVFDVLARKSIVSIPHFVSPPANAPSARH